MLEKKIKSWDGKEVEVSYIYKDFEGKEIDLTKHYEDLKEDIKKQGFTYTEDKKSIRINETSQFILKLPIESRVGILKARSLDFVVGDLYCEYPKKKNLIEEGENYFIKEYTQGRNIKFTLRA